MEGTFLDEAKHHRRLGDAADPAPPHQIPEAFRLMLVLHFSIFCMFKDRLGC